jgi:iron complex outermembrane recepter protein
MTIRPIAAALLCAHAASPALADTSAADSGLETVIVTATREARTRSQLPESVEAFDAATIRHVMPTHPAELLNRAAGVHVNNLGGEGHMTSIRQPLTTGGVYLFLEDGIPTRPTGFFNHNGLYEINIPQASGVEVTKGPGSALYGSDAIGGIVNSLTRAPRDTADLEATFETGSDGWRRGLLEANTPIGERSRALVQVNLTESDGFRDAGSYDRQSVLARWDAEPASAWSVKTVATLTRVNQDGVSGLDERDYRHGPERNLYHGDIGFREVEALRVSSAVEWAPNERHSLVFTPYYRDNRMDLMPSWMLTYDANVYRTDFDTWGLLAKHRWRNAGASLEWITGLDVDYTPSSYRELRITTTRAADGSWVDYAFTGRVNYDFDADQRSVSPYTQMEWAASEQLRLSAGVRHDRFEVEYSDRLDASAPESSFAPFFRHYRPEDQKVSWQHTSPKLGLVYEFMPGHRVFANWRHAFRVPTAGQLFRSGSVVESDRLEPVEADSREIGINGSWHALGWELTVYDMEVSDDIVSIIEGGTRKNVNAGETTHRGVETLLAAELGAGWSARLALTWTEQEYDDFAYVCGTATCNFAGKDVGKAPKTIGNATLAWQPPALHRLRLEAEWEHLGEYYTDETNTQSYDGHDLLNLRASFRVDPRWLVFARVQNLSDARHSTYTANQVGSPLVEYRPGMPRSFFLGVTGAFR